LAIDKGATNTQDVDLDDLEVVILVIVKNPSKISQASNFLSRRGWPTTVTSSLSHAIEFASAQRPDIVLISVNHPSPAVTKFSGLLNSTFGSTCVAFAENHDNKSASQLVKYDLPLKIQGQASGPNLHRSLRKILAEQLNISLDERGQVPERKNSSDHNPNFKGSAANDGHTIVQKNDPGATQNHRSTMIKGEDPDTAGSGQFDKESVSTGKYTMTKKTRRSMKELSKNPLDKPGNIVMGESKDIAEKLKKSLFGDLSEVESHITENEDDPGEAESSDELNGRSITSRQSAMGNLGKSSAQMNSQGSNRQSPNQGSPEERHSGAIGHPGYKPGALSTNGLNQKEDGDHSSAGDTKSPFESEKKSSHSQKSLASVGPHSIIERAVQEAIREITRPGAARHEPLQVIGQVGVFPVDSPTLPGYLVLAWSHEEKSAIEPFFQQAEIIIGNKFKEMGVQAHLETGFFVTIPQVEFGTWVDEASSFFFSTAHGNEEIGVAFFPTQKPIPKPKQIEDRNMCSIGLEEISTEQPVNFKVYLHMKKNKKYFLYLRNGRQLQPEQKERLEGHKVKDLYMKSIDIENLRMFLASCHLRKRIKKAG
jgi:hypothetical protein